MSRESSKATMNAARFGLAIFGTSELFSLRFQHTKSLVSDDLEGTDSRISASRLSVQIFRMAEVGTEGLRNFSHANKASEKRRRNGEGAERVKSDRRVSVPVVRWSRSRSRSSSGKFEHASAKIG